MVEYVGAVGQGFATVLRATDTPIGSTAFLAADEGNRRVEIGATWITPAHQRSAANTEAKLLQLTHTFEVLGCARVELKTDAAQPAITRRDHAPGRNRGGDAPQAHAAARRHVARQRVLLDRRHRVARRAGPARGAAGGWLGEHSELPQQEPHGEAREQQAEQRASRAVGACARRAPSRAPGTRPRAKKPDTAQSTSPRRGGERRDREAATTRLVPVATRMSRPSRRGTAARAGSRHRSRAAGGRRRTRRRARPGSRAARPAVAAVRPAGGRARRRQQHEAEQDQQERAADAWTARAEEAAAAVIVRAVRQSTPPDRSTSRPRRGAGHDAGSGATTAARPGTRAGRAPASRTRSRPEHAVEHADGERADRGGMPLAVAPYVQDGFR